MDHADSAVVGTVQPGETFVAGTEGSPVDTLVPVNISLSLKGKQAATYKVRVHGGAVNGRHVVMASEPVLTAGERKIFFLRELPDGTYRASHPETGIIGDTLMMQRNPVHNPMFDRDPSTLTLADGCTGSAGPGGFSGFNTMNVDWPSNSETLYLNPTASAFKSSIDAAMASWNSQGAAFTINDGGATSLTGIGNHGGTNVISFESHPEWQGEVARTYSWSDPNHTPRTYTEADIVFNTAYSWVNGNPASGQYDVQTVALHELGHSFGLDHVNDSRQAMYPIYCGGGTMTTLGYGDQAGIRNLYPPNKQGYTMAVDTGAVYTLGGFGAYTGVNAAYYGGVNIAGTPFPAARTVDLKLTPSRQGYWVMLNNGSIYAFGDAVYYGGGNTMLNCSCFVGMAVTASGRGYWLLTNGGGIYTFGDAPYQGNGVAGTAVGIARAGSTGGYWLVNSSGNVYSYGPVPGYYGGLSTSGVTSIESTVTGQGYWIQLSAGNVYTFGNAVYHGGGGPGSLHLSRHPYYDVYNSMTQGGDVWTGGLTWYGKGDTGRTFGGFAEGVRPDRVPDKPLTVVANGGTTYATVTWNTPFADPAIDHYVVTAWKYVNGGFPYADTNVPAQNVPAGVNNALVPGLDPTAPYQIHVSAVNSVGSSQDGVSNTVFPALIAAVAQNPASDGLGLEKFYPYSATPVGTGTAYTNLYNGNLVVQYTDMKLPATGLNMVVKRTYNSQRRDQSDTVGRGWQLSIADGSDAVQGAEGAAVALSLTDALHYAQGLTSVYAEFRLTDGDGTTQTFVQQTLNGPWSSPPGVNLMMRSEAPGFMFLRPDGVIYHVANVGSAAIPDYRLVTIADRKGNVLNFTYEANGPISHRIKSIANAQTPTRTITFAYSANQPAIGVASLASITAPNGYSVTYNVVAESGNLSSVTEDANGLTDPQNKRTTNFNYSPKGSEPVEGLLLSIEDARSVGGANDSVGTQRLTTFGYTTDPAQTAYGTGWGLNARARLLTQITDRAGALWKYGYGGAGGARSAAGANQMTTLTDGRGNPSVDTIEAIPAPVGTSQQAANPWSGRLIKRVDEGDIGQNGVARPNTTSYSWNTGGRSQNRLANITDPVGQQTNYAYDALGGITSVTRPAPNVAGGANSAPVTDTLTYLYSNARAGCTDSDPAVCNAAEDLTDTHNANATPDERDQHFDYFVDPTQGATTCAAPTAPSCSGLMSASTTGNLSNAQASDHRVTTFNYYDLGRLKSVTDADNHTTTYGDPNVSDKGYDPTGLAKKITDAMGYVKVFAYDTFGMTTSSTDRNGKVVTMSYTEREQLKETDQQVGPQLRQTLYKYDANGNRLQVTSPLGNVSKSTYDVRDGVASGIDAKSVAQTYTYDNNGNKATMTSRNGATTTWNYFPDNRLQNVQAPAPNNTAGSIAQTDYTYFPDGRAQTVKAPAVNGVQTTHTAAWTPAGRLSTETDTTGYPSGQPQATTTTYCYDGVGNQIFVRQPKSVDTSSCPAAADATVIAYVNRSTFDKLNQRIQQTSYVAETNGPLSPVNTSYTFDQAGNQLSASQPTQSGAQQTTHTAFDALNRINWMDDPTNPSHTSCFAYDNEGHQTDRRDATAATSRACPPTDGYVVRATSQTYNDDYSKRDTVVTTYTADVMHTVIQILTTSYHASAGDVTGTGYDSDGNLHHVETTRSDLLDPTTHASTPFETLDIPFGIGTGYDPNGRLLRETTTLTPSLTGIATDAPSRTQTYTYDGDGNLQSRLHPGADTDFDTTFQYFPNDQVSQASARSKPVNLTYQPDGRELTRVLGNGLIQTSTYYQNGKLSELQLAAGSQALLDYSGIAYDGNSNKQSEVAKAAQTGGLPAKNGTARYGYDEMNRLLSYTAPWTGSSNTQYALDDAGNILTESDSGPPSTTMTSTFQNNQLTRRTYTYPTNYTSTYGYDQLGQQTSRQVLGAPSETSTYDAAGNTASHSFVVNPADPGAPPPGHASSVNYVYDGFGRIVRRIESGNTANSYLLFYDGLTSNLSEEIDLPTATSMVRYVRLPSGQALEQFDRIALHNENRWTWYGYDSRGNVANRTDDLSGAVVETVAYDPYGKADTAGSSNAGSGPQSRLGFQGAWKDSVSQQYVLGSRLYDPSQARFTSADSMGSAAADFGLGSDPLTGNRYLYAGANPAGYIDDGHRPLCGCPDDGGGGWDYQQSHLPPATGSLPNTSGDPWMNGGALGGGCTYDVKATHSRSILFGQRYVAAHGEVNCNSPFYYTKGHVWIGNPFGDHTPGSKWEELLGGGERNDYYYGPGGAWDFWGPGPEQGKYTAYLSFVALTYFGNWRGLPDPQKTCDGYGTNRLECHATSTMNYGMLGPR